MDSTIIWKITELNYKLQKYFRESFQLNLSIMRLLSSKRQGRKDFWKPSKPCHVGSHWITIAEYSQMNTHEPRFQSFFRYFTSFYVAQISHQQHKG